MLAWVSLSEARIPARLAGCAFVAGQALEEERTAETGQWANGRGGQDNAVRQRRPWVRLSSWCGGGGDGASAMTTRAQRQQNQSLPSTISDTRLSDHADAHHWRLLS